MSYQNKNFWARGDAMCLTDGDISYDPSSRIEPKRVHQWLMDDSGPEVYCNKKQSIEAVNRRPLPGFPNVSASLCENNSSFNTITGQSSDYLLGSENPRTFNLVNRSISAVGTRNMNMERNSVEDQFGSDSSVFLSMAQTTEDLTPCLSYGGIRKVRVNQVRDSENGMPVSVGQPYSHQNNTAISTGTADSKAYNGIPLGPTENTGEENAISLGAIFTNADHSFVNNRPLNGDDNFMLMGHNYSKGDDSFLLIGQPLNREDEGFISMVQPYGKGNGNIMSVGSAYDKDEENLSSIDSAYNRSSEIFNSIGLSYSKRDENIGSLHPTTDKADTNVLSMCTTYDKGNSSILSMAHNYKKGESSTISFGSPRSELEINPSFGIINGFETLTSHGLSQTFQAHEQTYLTDHNTVQFSSVTPAATFTTGATPKNKAQKPPKTVPPNTFPSNVKSFLSTGMLDGVPVKYVSWSRETNLQGIIKGTGYLCGCSDCKFSKALNAYEFERHAGLKTKHPNNHIYFENGKTIYAVVQELKSTPQEMLFEAIQNVTGSPINQKNYHIWKMSYQAATRELQRIYGTDEVIMPS